MARRKPALRFLVEIVCLLCIFAFFCRVSGLEVRFWAKDLFPLIDVTEQVYMTAAMVEGRSPLLPIGHELHPARFSPVHPFFMLSSVVLSGSWKGVFWYPPLMMLAGGLVFYLALRLFFPVKIGLPVLALLMTSRVFILTAENCQQEPTMWVLFSTVVLMGAMSARVGNQRILWATLLAAAAGMCSGLLMAIRPSLVPLVVLLPAGLWISFSTRTRATAVAVAYLLGAAATIGAVGAYMHRLTGSVSMTGYDHWFDTSTFFRLDNLWRRLNCTEYPGLTALHQILSDLIGRRPGLTILGPAFTGCLWLGLPFGLRTLIVRKNYLWLALLLFAVSQVVLHLFYEYYFPRFLLLAFSSLLLTAVVGWDDLFNLVLMPIRGSRARRLAIIGAMFLAGFLVFGLRSRRLVFSYYEKLADMDELNTVRMDQIATGLEDAGARVGDLSCPIFVEGIDVVAFRLQCGLVDYPHPVYQLTNAPLASCDGYTWQTPGAKKRMANPDVSQPNLPGNPPFHGIFLFDLKNNKLNLPVLDHLLGKYGRLAIFDRQVRVPQLPIKDKLMAASYDLEAIPLNRSDWRLFVVKERP